MVILFDLFGHSNTWQCHRETYMFSQHNTCPIIMNIGLGIKFIIEIGFTCKLLVLGGTLDFDFFQLTLLDVML